MFGNNICLTNWSQLLQDGNAPWLCLLAAAMGDGSEKLILLKQGKAVSDVLWKDALNIEESTVKVYLKLFLDKIRWSSMKNYCYKTGRYSTKNVILLLKYPSIWMLLSRVVKTLSTLPTIYTSKFPNVFEYYQAKENVYWRHKRFQQILACSLKF